MLRMCLNKKVLLALGAVAVGGLVFAPELLGAALPILLLAVCPVSMLLMMKAMCGGGEQRDAQQTEASSGPASTPAPASASTQPESVEQLEERLRRLRVERATLDERATIA